MVEPFPAILNQHLREKKLSKRQFALAIQMHPPTLHAVLSGKRPFPEKCIADGIKVLGLTGVDQQQFKESAAMTHASDIIKALVQRLETEAQKNLKRPKR